MFGVLARFYSETQSRNQLIKDANAIYDIIINEEKNKDLTDPAEKLEIRKRVLNEVGSIDSNFALVSKDLKVLYPKNKESERFEAQVLPKVSKYLNTKNNKFMRIQLDGIEYMLVILPPRNNVAQSLKGSVILYNPVGPMQKLNRAMIIVLLLSLAITAIMAIAAGIFMAKNIAKPIIMLKDRADSLSRRDFEGSVQIHTGDELEELGDTINKMAVKLMEHDVSQKNFFQNASHELKTPLMSIQGYAEGIKDKVFDNNDEALDIIIDESKRLKSLVDELLLLSKVEAGDDFYAFKPESINDVIACSVEKLKGISIKDNINIKLSLDQNVELTIDKNRMTQALINLMGNCLRYAKSQTSVSVASNDKWCEITIKDDGEGFDDEALKNVFTRFYKGRNGNTGLGLAITKSIIEGHNGFITAENSPAGGAMFKIRLPVS